MKPIKQTKNIKELTRKDNIKNYLLFRLSVESALDEVKNKIKENLAPYKTKITETKNISLQKINFYITLFKPNFKKDNISDEIFSTLINSFDYTAQNYIDNEKIIKDYIKFNIESQIELNKLRASIRQEIKEYKETNKNSINFNAAENAFIELRKNIKESKLDINYMNDLYEAREVAKEIMDSEMKIETAVPRPKKQPKPKKHKFTEKEILEILLGNKEIKESIEKL